MKEIVECVMDTDSILELRGGYGIGICTCLARLEGRPIGVIANNPKHLGGAIDVDAALKVSRFMELCDAYDIAIVFFVDTPGFMVDSSAKNDVE